MATKVVMAQLSPTMEEGKLVEWKVAEGDTISQGDLVAEIETDKANMEIEALGGGVLRKIVVEAGQTVPVGALIGVIAEPGESIDKILASAKAEDTPQGTEDSDFQTDPAGETQARAGQSTGTSTKDPSVTVASPTVTSQSGPVPVPAEGRTRFPDWRRCPAGASPSGS